MQPHHTLMVKHGGGGEVTEAISIPNNQWAKHRRTGWEFATTDEVTAFIALNVHRAEAEAIAQAKAKERTPDKDDDAPPKKAPAKKKSTTRY